MEIRHSLTAARVLTAIRIVKYEYIICLGGGENTFCPSISFYENDILISVLKQNTRIK